MLLLLLALVVFVIELVVVALSLFVPLATLEVAGERDDRREGIEINLYSRRRRRSSSLGAGETIALRFLEA